jgi:PPOX class probable F420-dependent enzyme
MSSDGAGHVGEDSRVNRDEAVARLRSARVGRLATITPGSRPHVVPFVFAVVEDASVIRVYWVVDDKPKRSPRLQRIRNLEANPAAELVVDGYDEAWSELWWVRAAGAGRIVQEPTERATAMAALEAKYPQYAAARPPGPVVAIDVESITGWSAETGSEP